MRWNFLLCWQDPQSGVGVYIVRFPNPLIHGSWGTWLAYTPLPRSFLRGLSESGFRYSDKFKSQSLLREKGTGEWSICCAHEVITRSCAKLPNKQYDSKPIISHCWLSLQYNHHQKHFPQNGHYQRNWQLEKVNFSNKICQQCNPASNGAS